jgi:hypothetical protein
MIATSGDILRPILVLQDNLRPLFDLCHQLTHPPVKESPLRGAKNRDMAGGKSEVIPRYPGQTQAGVKVAVAV